MSEVYVPKWQRATCRAMGRRRFCSWTTLVRPTLPPSTHPGSLFVDDLSHAGAVNCFAPASPAAFVLAGKRNAARRFCEPHMDATQRCIMRGRHQTLRPEQTPTVCSSTSELWTVALPPPPCLPSSIAGACSQCAPGTGHGWTRRGQQQTAGVPWEWWRGGGRVGFTSCHFAEKPSANQCAGAIAPVVVVTAHAVLHSKRASQWVLVYRRQPLRSVWGTDMDLESSCRNQC